MLSSQLLQTSLTFCDPVDCSPPGSSLTGILQARILEWVACPPPGGLPHPGIEPTSPALAGGFFISEPVGKPQSRVKCQSLSRVQLFATPQSAAHQTPLSMGFSRQEYWSGLPSLLLGIFPTQGSSLSLLHCRWILYSLSPQGSP